MAGAPKENTNAEKWNIKEATKFMEQCYELSKRKIDYTIYGKSIKGYEFHFIGEIATELDQYSDLPLYLSDKFDELKYIFKKIKSKLESNCFSDSKKGIIKEATAIMNLKSNYKWKDRVDNTSNDKEIQSQTFNIGGKTISFE